MKKRYRSMRVMSMTLLWAVMLFSTVQLAAQAPFKPKGGAKFGPSSEVVCPSSGIDGHTHHEFHSPLFEAMAHNGGKRTAAQEVEFSGIQTANIVIDFGPGFALLGDDEQAARDAFRFAADIWETEVVSTVPILISAEFANLGPGVLGQNGSPSVTNVPNAPDPSTNYTLALANAIAGVDLAPGTPNGNQTYNTAFTWYFGTDGNTPSGQTDFVTVVLHEIGHSMGISGIGNGGAGVGAGGGANPRSWDLLVELGDGTPILDLGFGSAEQQAALVSNDLFINGPLATAALGGQRPKIFAPNPFQGGSSYSHWDEATFPEGDPNALMTPQVGSGVSNFNIGDITRGVLADQGWQLSSNLEAQDVGIVAITSPVSDSDLGMAETIEVSVRNFGIEDASGFTISYSVDGGAPVTEAFVGILPAISVTTFTFATTADLSSDGTSFSVEAFTTLTGDEDSSNDAASSTIVNLVPEAQLSAAEIDFGSLGVGNEGTGAITISSVLSGPLSGEVDITDILIQTASSGIFTALDAGNLPITIAAGESADLSFSYSPTALGSDAATATITTNAGTFEVSLVGQGEEPALIEVTPESIVSELEIGEEETQQITITNTGAADLNFSLALVKDAGTTMTSVAAPFKGVSNAVRTNTPLQSKINTSLKVKSGNDVQASVIAENSVYVVDDGSGENNIGLNAVSELMWMNAFQTAAGAQVITSISSAVASGAAETPARFILYDDPDNDGDPSNAVFLTEASGVLTNPGEDVFTTVSIPATEVEGVFFIAVLVAEDPAVNAFPMPLDGDSGSQQASWVIGNQAASGFDVLDLGANSLPPLLIDNAAADGSLAGNWLLRADGEFFTASPTSGTVAQGESVTVDVNFSGDVPGTFNSNIVISSNAPNNPEIQIPVMLTVEGVAITASPSPIIETLDQGRTSTQVLTLSNAGGSDVTFSIALEDLGLAPPVDVMSAQGFSPLSNKRNTAYAGAIFEGSNAIISGETNKVGAIQLETSFEDFLLGDLNGQNGWVGQFSNWIVENTNPSDGNQQVRSLSDGLGQTLAFSPEVAIGEDPLSSLSMDVAFNGTGVTWDIIPQSGTAGSVNTRLRFNPDGSVSALVNDPVAGGIFVPLGINTPDGYFNVRIEVVRATNDFTIYFDDEVVFEGIGFAGDIEQLVLLSLMEVAGPTMDIDNIQIFDGESGAAGAPAIQVETLAGVVPAGGSVDVNVLFDANRDFGTYTADLVITLNDNPAIDPLVVEAVLNVIGDPTIMVDPTVVQEISNFNVMSTRTVTITNTGGQPLVYDLNVIGNDIGVNTSEMSTQLDQLTATSTEAIFSKEVNEKIARDESLTSLKAVQSDDSGEIFITLGDVVFEENFDGGTFPPAGWTTVDNEGAGVEWGFSADVGEANYSGSGEAATVSSDAFGSAEFDAELISPAINVAGKSNLTLKYNVNYQNFAALDFFDLDASTDGGATWVNVLSWNEDHGAFRALPGEAVNVPMDEIIAGADEVMFRWHYYDPNTGDFDWYAQIDDVELVENSEVWLAVDETSGVVPVGGTAEVELTFDPTVVDPGLYVAGIIVNSNAVNTPVVGVVVSMEELNPAEISVSPESLEQELVAGRVGTQTLTITNNGESILDFNFSETFPNVGTAESATTSSREGVAKDKSEITTEIDLLSTRAIPSPSTGDVSYSIEGPVEFSNVQYSTNFETFGLGDINFQQGWSGQFVNWVISEESPAGGSQHMRSVSDGLGQTLAFSPAVGIGTEPVSSTAMTVDLEGAGVTWQIIPQSPTAGSVITRLSFDPDGTMSALVDTNGGEFETIPVDIPEGQFNLAIQVERATNVFTVSIDGTDVFTGTGFAGDIEQLVLLSLMEIADPILDIDNLQIVDGVIPDPVISTSPSAGSIASGASLDVDVTFNATNLDGGVYSNDLVINNNDPSNSPLVVPTTLTVIGAQVISIDPTAVSDTLEIGEMSTQTITVTNDGEADLIFDINIPGDLVVPNAVHGEEPVNNAWKNDPATVAKLAEDQERSLDISFVEAASVERSATVALIFEGFEGETFPPEGWTTLDNEGNGVEWGFSADVGEANYSSTGEAATVSSDRFGSAEFDAELWTPEIDVDGRTGIVLEYAVNYQNFAALDFFDTDISTDGGATWTNMISWNEDHGAFRALPGETVSIELDDFIGDAASFIVRWHYYDPNTGDFDWYAQVDDVVIGVPWLTVLNASDTVPGGSSVEVPVKFDASALTPGQYNTNLVVCSNDLRNPQVTVPASLYVLRPATIEVSPSPVEVTLFEGFETDAAFEISNSGETSLDYSIANMSEIVTINSGASGTVGAESSGEVTLGISAVGLTPGVYSETLEISSNDPENPTVSLMVNVTVEDFVVLDMEVEPTCTDNPDATRAWSVNNPNTFARDALWFIVGSGQFAEITLEPGENIITANTETAVDNTLELRWLDGEEVQQSALSESEGAPCDVRGLILTPVCSDNPELFRKWEINNRNAFTISVEYNIVIQGPDPVGFVSCAPGISTFFTPTVDGENKVKIIWIDEEGNPRRQQKVSDGEVCDIDNSCAGGEVIAFEQGSRINGKSISELRSNPLMALGAPELGDGFNFVSLGIEGSITIKLGSTVVDQPGDDFVVIETSYQDTDAAWDSYPESADVYVSADGVNFVLVGEAQKDSQFDIASANLTEISYVRVVDTSNPTLFGPNADGFDLDGVACINAFSSQTSAFDYQPLDNNVTDEEIDATVTTFPNPFTDRIAVTMDVPSEGEGDYTIYVYDLFGALVYEGVSSTTFGKLEKEIGVENLAKGTYTLRLISANGAVDQSQLLIKR